MTIVNIDAAEADLSQLLARVEAGEDIVLTRCDMPIAKLTRYTEAERKSGAMKGKIDIGPKFFEPLPEEELKAWE